MGYGPGPWTPLDGESEVDALRRENARLRAERERLAVALIEASIAVYAAVAEGQIALAVGNVAVERLNAICHTLQTEVA